MTVATEGRDEDPRDDGAVLHTAECTDVDTGCGTALPFARCGISYNRLEIDNHHLKTKSLI